MTSVDFYFNVIDKEKLVSNLVQSALKKSRQITIFTQDEPSAQQVSANLWQQEAESFIPNVLANHDLAKLTPVLIDWRVETVMQDDILINLQSQQLMFFTRFNRLLEIVGEDEEDKTQARKRYSFYRDRGYEIKPVDMFKKSI
jgi:DNA polymerase III subunit chi